MRTMKSLPWIGIALAAIFFLLTPLPLFSQSCALCYTQAASSGSKVIQALKSGILVLIIPPTLMSVGLVYVVHRKNDEVRRTENDSDSDGDSGQDW